MFLVIALAIAGAVMLAHSAPFPFLLEAFRPSRSVWRMPQTDGSRHVYLTFDDGPNAAWTPQVLDALRDVGATATFFLIPDHIVPDTEGVVRRIVAEGHAVALHSGSRRPMVMPPDALAAQLQAATDRIARLTGRAPCRLFRPHAGWRSATMYEALERLDFRLAGWSWGMWDWNWWQQPQAAAVARRLERKASPGDIIVIHDGHHADPARDRSHAGGAVRLLVPALRHRGFTFAALCDAGGGPAERPSQGTLRNPSVSSIDVPHGSVMNALPMLLRPGSLRYGTVSVMPFAPSPLQNSSRFFTSNPTWSTARP
jgi:peptidoglycan-N-acetylglucosamine deacetylase